MATFYEGFLTAGPTKDADGMTSFTVEFRKDLSPTITQNMRVDVFTAALLKQFVIDKAAALNAVPEVVPQGKIDTTVTPLVVDAAAVAWQTDYGRFLRANDMVNAGVIASNNATFVALKTRLKNNFKATYIDFV